MAGHMHPNRVTTRLAGAKGVEDTKLPVTRTAGKSQQLCPRLTSLVLALTKEQSLFSRIRKTKAHSLGGIPVFASGVSLCQSPNSSDLGFLTCGMGTPMPP